MLLLVNCEALIKTVKLYYRQNKLNRNFLLNLYGNFLNTNNCSAGRTCNAKF